MTYQRRLVIPGDISGYVAQSRAVSDFVDETSRGTQVWFLRDLHELNGRLTRTTE